MPQTRLPERTFAAVAVQVQRAMMMLVAKGLRISVRGASKLAWDGSQ